MKTNGMAMRCVTQMQMLEAVKRDVGGSYEKIRDKIMNVKKQVFKSSEKLFLNARLNKKF